MPKRVKELSETSIRRLKHTYNTSGEPYKAVHAVGGVSGLYLQCLPPISGGEKGAKQWLYRSVIGGKRRWIGLGGYPSVPTKKARESARALQDSIKSGIDPVSEKRAVLAELKAKQAKEITFEGFTRSDFIPKEAKEYKSTTQVRRLNQHLRDYVFLHIGNLLLNDIERIHIVNLLKPIWETKNPTAKRVRNHVQRIIQRAIAEGLRTKANPAVWKDDLELSFPKASKVHTVKHRRSIDWRELPKFVKAIHGLEVIKGSRPDVHCMLFMILTVSRPSEARLVEWDEIDLEARVWKQPKGKYKAEKLDWDIPLCPTAIKILKSMPTRRGRVFSTLRGAEIHDKYLSTMPDALGFDAVAHGFRATFRTWGQDQQRFTEESLELSMKHVDTDSTRAAYARSQLFDERRRVISAYEKWAMKGDLGQDKTVVSINKRKRAS